MAMQSRIARLVAQMAAIAAAGSTQGQGTGFLFDRAERPLTIPLAMNVGLLGFVDPESDTAAQRPAGHSFVKGCIDSTQLESALAKAKVEEQRLLRVAARAEEQTRSAKLVAAEAEDSLTEQRRVYRSEHSGNREYECSASHR